jgi:transposase InsO family protein
MMRGRFATDALACSARRGFLKRTRYLIHDRDPLFTERFREILKPSGVKTVKLAARSPDLNAYAERFVHSVKSECLAKIIPLGERHLRKAVKEYTEHYHLERNHQVLPLHGNTVQSDEVHQQGLDNELIEKLTDSPSMDAAVECRKRLGGILNYYHRRAA